MARVTSQGCWLFPTFTTTGNRAGTHATPRPAPGTDRGSRGGAQKPVGDCFQLTNFSRVLSSTQSLLDRKRVAFPKRGGESSALENPQAGWRAWWRFVHNRGSTAHGAVRPVGPIGPRQGPPKARRRWSWIVTANGTIDNPGHVTVIALSLQGGTGAPATRLENPSVQKLDSPHSCLIDPIPSIDIAQVVKNLRRRDNAL